MRAIGGGAIAAVAVGFAVEQSLDFHLPTAPASHDERRAAASVGATSAAAPPAQTPVIPNPSKPNSEPTPGPAAAPAPAFDIVRVEPTGEAVVAGHASPRAIVELRDDDRVLASVAADDNGQFVILPEPLTVGPHRLRLAAKVGNAEARLSDVVTVEVAQHNIAALHSAPSSDAAKQPEATPGGSAAPIPALSTANVSGTTSTIALQPKLPVPSPVATTTAALAIVPTAPSPKSPDSSPLAATNAAPAILSSALAPKPPVPSPDAVRLPAQTAAVAELLPPSPLKSSVAPWPDSTVSSRLLVDTVRTAKQGRWEAEGRAAPGARLRLTLNDAYLGEAVAGSDGLWSLTIERGMAAGLYVLAAEQLDPSGRAAARAQASFVYPQNPPQESASIASPQRPANPTVEAPKPSPNGLAELGRAPVSPTEPLLASQATAASATAIASPLAIPGPPALEPPEATPTLDANAPAALVGPAAAPPSAVASPAALAHPAVVAASAPTPASAFSNPSQVVVAEVRTTTVVRGDNLWDIARRFYGDGLYYSDIYSANFAKIRNPNLIYIGQVFVVPQQGSPRR